ncbi:MAG TPA: hypothetical protein ACQGQX_08390, partial [Xylella taiwanensis]
CIEQLLTGSRLAMYAAGYRCRKGKTIMAVHRVIQEMAECRFHLQHMFFALLLQSGLMDLVQTTEN